MNTFDLKIIACDRIFYEGPATILVFPVEDGEMAVQAHHEQMMTTTEGILTVRKNTVELIVYSAERPEEIDAFRAEAAAERAREQLQQHQSVVDYHIASASLARAMARLAGKDRYVT